MTKKEIKKQIKLLEKSNLKLFDELSELTEIVNDDSKEISDDELTNIENKVRLNLIVCGRNAWLIHRFNKEGKNEKTS